MSLGSRSVVRGCLLLSKQSTLNSGQAIGNLKPMAQLPRQTSGALGRALLAPDLDPALTPIPLALVAKPAAEEPPLATSMIGTSMVATPTPLPLVTPVSVGRPPYAAQRVAAPDPLVLPTVPEAVTSPVGHQAPRPMAEAATSSLGRQAPSPAVVVEAVASPQPSPWDAGAAEEARAQREERRAERDYNLRMQLARNEELRLKAAAFKAAAAEEEKTRLNETIHAFGQQLQDDQGTKAQSARLTIAKGAKHYRTIAKSVRPGPYFDLESWLERYTLTLECELGNDVTDREWIGGVLGGFDAPRMEKYRKVYQQYMEECAQAHTPMAKAELIRRLVDRDHGRMLRPVYQWLELHHLVTTRESKLEKSTATSFRTFTAEFDARWRVWEHALRKAVAHPDDVGVSEVLEAVKSVFFFTALPDEIRGEIQRRVHQPVNGLLDEDHPLASDVISAVPFLPKDKMAQATCNYLDGIPDDAPRLWAPDGMFAAMTGLGDRGKGDNKWQVYTGECAKCGKDHATKDCTADLSRGCFNCKSKKHHAGSRLCRKWRTRFLPYARRMGWTVKNIPDENASEEGTTLNAMFVGLEPVAHPGRAAGKAAEVTLGPVGPRCEPPAAQVLAGFTGRQVLEQQITVHSEADGWKQAAAFIDCGCSFPAVICEEEARRLGTELMPDAGHIGTGGGALPIVGWTLLPIRIRDYAAEPAETMLIRLKAFVTPGATVGKLNLRLVLGLPSFSSLKIVIDGESEFCYSKALGFKVALPQSWQIPAVRAFTPQQADDRLAAAVAMPVALAPDDDVKAEEKMDGKPPAIDDVKTEEKLDGKPPAIDLTAVGPEQLEVLCEEWYAYFSMLWVDFWATEGRDKKALAFVSEHLAGPWLAFAEGKAPRPPHAVKPGPIQVEAPNYGPELSKTERELFEALYFLHTVRGAFGEVRISKVAAASIWIKPGAAPARQALRRYPKEVLDWYDAKIDALEKLGIIAFDTKGEAVHLAMPVFPKKKGPDKFRLCIDYTLLNSISLQDSFALPLIPDILDALVADGHEWFSKWDNWRSL